MGSHMIEFMPFPDFCGPRNVILSWRFRVLYLDWTFHTHELGVRSAIGRFDFPAWDPYTNQFLKCATGDFGFPMKDYYGPMPPIKCVVKDIKRIQHHDDVIKWKHFPRYSPFVRGTTGHRWIPLCGALMFSLICAWTNRWVNNRNSGYLRRHHAHFDITVMVRKYSSIGICMTERDWTLNTQASFENLN